MLNDIKPNQNKVLMPPMLCIGCILAFLGTLHPFLLAFSELSYNVGDGILNSLPISSIIIWVSLVVIWKMKKWGVFIYTATIISTQTILRTTQPTFAIGNRGNLQVIGYSSLSAIVPAAR